MAEVDFTVDDEAKRDMEEDEIIFTPETLEAIEEAERIARAPNAKTYNSFDEILQEIDEEIAEEDKARACAKNTANYPVQERP